MPDDWREVEVEVATADVDRLSGELWVAGAAGIEERQAENHARLIVAVRADAVDAVLHVLAPLPVAVRSVAADTGLDAWREHATVTRVGDVVIQPMWLPDAATGPTDVIVRLDPGRVFGSGAHVTTRLALELLAAESIAGQRVLDLGTGSGVLAIAAAALGASQVLAVDNDEVALEIARQNVERNRAGSTVVVSDVLVGAFDVAVANITVPTLVALSSELLVALRPGGRLVLSGILLSQEQEQEQELVMAFDGVRWVDRRAEADWIARAGRQPD